jgi:hypothetical protein
MAGAILASGERVPSPDALGTALALIFAMSLAASLVGMLASRRLGPVSDSQGTEPTAVD